MVQQQRQAKGTKSKLKANAAVSQGSVTSEKSIGFTNHKNSLLDESISANSVVNMQQQLQKMSNVNREVTGKRGGGSRTHAEGSRNRASGRGERSGPRANNIIDPEQIAAEQIQIQNALVQSSLNSTIPQKRN